MRNAKLFTVIVVGLLSGCSSTKGDSGPAAAPEPAAEAEGVLIVGTLVHADDLSAAQAQHDPVAQGGEGSAKTAGDVGHTVMLGTTLLGTTSTSFWRSIGGTPTRTWTRSTRIRIS